MIEKPASAAARTTILPHTLQHADSIAGEMHRIALGFSARNKYFPTSKDERRPHPQNPFHLHQNGFSMLAQASGRPALWQPPLCMV